MTCCPIYCSSCKDIWKVEDKVKRLKICLAISQPSIDTPAVAGLQVPKNVYCLKIKTTLFSIQVVPYSKYIAMLTLRKGAGVNP